MMEMIDMSDIGKLVHYLRWRRGWSRQKLADKLWLDADDIYQLEHGNDMSFVDVVCVLQTLDVSVIIRLPDKEE